MKTSILLTHCTSMMHMILLRTCGCCYIHH